MVEEKTLKELRKEERAKIRAERTVRRAKRLEQSKIYQEYEPDSSNSLNDDENEEFE